MGEKPTQLGKGSFGRAFLNKENELVMKSAESIEKYRNFFLEAMVMKVFAENPSGVQRLLGLWPERLCLVTEDAGLSLDYCARSSRLEPEHRFSVATKMCEVLSHLHQNGFAQNDIKPQNVCLRQETRAADPVK